MSQSSRRRLAEIVREPACDLAEAALLCCMEVQPDLDIEVELLRLDALADGMRSGGFVPDGPEDNARALAGYLAGDLGFSGDVLNYHDPRNGLLTSVMDRREGLPITLSIVYIAIAARLGVRAFGVNAPGHFLVGVSGSSIPELDSSVRPAILDPFHEGALLADEQVEELVRAATSGLVGFARSMVRPAAPAQVIRRLLDNLTRDFLAEGDAEDALWTVELKRLLPGAGPADTETHGRLLIQLGRYLEAAQVLEDGADEAEPGDVTDQLSRMAMRARAKMN